MLRVCKVIMHLVRIQNFSKKLTFLTPCSPDMFISKPVIRTRTFVYQEEEEEEESVC